MIELETESKAYKDEAVKYAKAELKRVPRLMRTAQWRYSDIHAVMFDDMPRSHDTRNNVEDRLVRQLDAQRELGQIKLAVELCTNRSQTILNALYFDPDEPSNIEVMLSLGYGSSMFSILKRRAFIQFSQAFRGY